MKALTNKLLRFLFFTFLIFAANNFNKVDANPSGRSVLDKTLATGISSEPFLSYVNESNLAVKEWMYDISYWNSGIVTAVEKDLVIKSWMVNKYYWNSCPCVNHYLEIIRDNDQKIEKWMINTAHWTI